MGFEEFLPEEREIKKEIKYERVKEKPEKINANQVYDVITSKKPDWQSIIYELIHTEQLDPWDIDIVILTSKYFEKIEELEIDFYISGKVLLAAALLLRVKSEFLLNRHIKSIDEILFGKKEETKVKFEPIELNESELPILIPKTPLSRLRKVTLTELIEALNKAINTETRRIKKDIEIERAKKLTRIDIPNLNKIPLKDRIKALYAKILTLLKKPQIYKITYSQLIGKEKNSKLSLFLPILHLDTLNKLWLEQENHLDEIYIYSYDYFRLNRDKFLKSFEDIEEDIEIMKKELGKETEEILESDKAENIDKSRLEKAREKLIEKKKLEEEVKKEIKEEILEELKELNQDIEKSKEESIEKTVNDEKELIKKEKIDKLTGFEDEPF